MPQADVTNWVAYLKETGQPSLMYDTPGIITVSGYVDIVNTDVKKLVKKQPRGVNPKTLVLVIIIDPLLSIIGDGESPQQVVFEERLLNVNFYHSVEIYDNQNMIAKIQEFYYVGDG